LRWEFGELDERRDVQMREEADKDEKREDKATTRAEDTPNPPCVVEPPEASEWSEWSEWSE
jgi:hypothetical protein